MDLIQSAKLNGHDSYRYLKDVLGRLTCSKLEKYGPEPLLTPKGASNRLNGRRVDDR
jgi:hypothetical protein